MINAFHKINSLRKAGNLEEALQMAESALKANASDLWLIRAMGWVLYSYMEKAAANCQFDNFLASLDRFASLHVDEGERVLLDGVMWSVRKILTSGGATGRQYDLLFSLLTSLPSPRAGKAYSSVLAASLKLYGKWNNLASFISWWDLSNLSAEDFKEVELDDGRKVLSLAERSIICFSKCIIKSGTAEQAEDFLPFVESVAAQHKEMRYLPYYLAKLYMRKGDKHAAFVFIKEFAKCRSKEFWVWQLLSETQDDAEMRMSFVCKALNCGGKEEMLVSLREQAASLFMELGYLSEAKYEVLKAIETRKIKGWNVTEGLNRIQEEKWFSQVATSPSGGAFYCRHLIRAEELIMGMDRKHVCLISYVNWDKHMASFVTEDRKRGFFRIPKNLSLERYCVVEISADELKEDLPTVVRGVDIVKGRTNPFFFRAFQGKLQNRSSFGLVNDVFVEHGLIYGLSSGTEVRGTACINYDKKKSRWGWRAIAIAVI